MFRMGKPVPARELSKLSEPMWILFFELHAGPWHTPGHIKRPDTRPIEAPNRVVEKSPCNTGGIHTRTAAIRPADLEAPLRQVDGHHMNLRHMLLPSQRCLGAEQASYDAGRRGHPTHQFSSAVAAAGQNLAQFIQTAVE